MSLGSCIARRVGQDIHVTLQLADGCEVKFKLDDAHAEWLRNQLDVSLHIPPVAATSTDVPISRL